MPIQRLGIANPSANTDTSLANFSAAHLVSVVAASKAITAVPTCKVTIWVVPANATLVTQYAYIAYNIQIPINTSFETFRFAVNAGDTLYVRSSVDSTSFHVNGVAQEDAAFPENIAQTFTNKVIRGEDNTIYLDSGDTADRRATAETGYVRFNTETDRLEVKNSITWDPLVFSKSTGIKLESKTVSELSTLVGEIGSIVYCSDASGGAVPAFYDGTNWRRFTDRTVVS